MKGLVERMDLRTMVKCSQVHNNINIHKGFLLEPIQPCQHLLQQTESFKILFYIKEEKK